MATATREHEIDFEGLDTRTFSKKGRHGLFRGDIYDFRFDTNDFVWVGTEHL